MSLPNSTNRPVSTWPVKRFLELDKQGAYPLAPIPEKPSPSVIIASGNVDPLIPVQLVDSGAGAIVLTFTTANMPNYIGHSYTFVKYDTSANKFGVTVTGAPLVIYGSAAAATAVYEIDTDANSGSFTIYVLDATHLYVTSSVNGVGA